MNTARVEKIISAIDIGSSKVCTMIAGQTDTGELIVLGSGQRESKGIKRGYISDIEKCELTVRNAVEQAERLAGLNIDKIIVGLSAGGLDSCLRPVEIELGGNRVEQHDIDELLYAGRSNFDVNGKTILHAQPTLYSLDGAGGVPNPIGLHADLLSVDVHFLMADPSPVRNLESTIRAAHLEPSAIVATPLATGLSCLTEEERDLGVALVEIGAAVTNVSVFIGGILVGLHTIQLGGHDITDQIASTFGLRRTQAERLKCYHGSALSSPRDNQDILEIDDAYDGANENKDGNVQSHQDQGKPRVTKAQLNSVICQKLDELISEINISLKEMGFSASRGGQIVITGGSAELTGIADYMQSALGRIVRIGLPAKLSGIPEAHKGPAFTALVGLIQYAVSDQYKQNMIHQIDNEYGVGVQSLLQRIINAFRDNF